MPDHIEHRPIILGELRMIDHHHLLTKIDQCRLVGIGLARPPREIPFGHPPVPVTRCNDIGVASIKENPFAHADSLQPRDMFADELALFARRRRV